MAFDASVVIATFGDKAYWDQIAQRAIKSVETQSNKNIQLVRVHDETLAIARNTGAERALSDNLVFLDADDELHPNYIEEMLKIPGDIKKPSILEVVDGVEGKVSFIPSRNLMIANHIVIGAMTSRAKFLEVGGFQEWECLEDWELWARMWLNGAVITNQPKAIYKIHVRPGSRNTDIQQQARVCVQIRSHLREVIRNK